MAESHEDYIARLTAGKRETVVGPDGLVRYADSGRRVRKDKGLRKPHPRHCRHCSMVEDYRLTRDSMIRAREVACADEDLVPVTFKEWLMSYRYEQEPEYSYGMAA